MFSSITYTCCLPANLALAVLKCHLPAACPKVGKAEENLCLRLSWGNTARQTCQHLSCMQRYLYALPAYRPCTVKHQSFREFNTHISPVSLNKAKYFFFFQRQVLGIAQREKNNTKSTDCLSEQGSTRMDLKHSESAHLKNWKGKKDHTCNQQVLKTLYKHRDGSDMDVTSRTYFWIKLGSPWVQVPRFPSPTL